MEYEGSDHEGREVPSALVRRAVSVAPQPKKKVASLEKAILEESFEDTTWTNQILIMDAYSVINAASERYAGAAPSSTMSWLDSHVVTDSMR